MVKVKKIFDVVYGINLELINCNETTPENGIPFVSRTSKNNGIVAFVELMDDVKPNPPNTISVAGSGSVLSCFYQESPYYSGRDLFYLKPKIKLSKKQMLFYCLALSSNKYKYSYGRQANRTLREISIPNVNEIPKNFLSFKVPKPKIKKTGSQHKLDTKHWKYFEIEKLFQLVKCKCSSAIELLTEGNDIFYIGAKKRENGIMQKVMRDEELVSEGNCIVFIGDGQGSVGYSLYQPDDFIGSTTLSCGYNEKINKYNALFIVTILDLERYRYSFGRKFSKAQIKNCKIKLPVKDNNPDWKFMENYIKSLPYSISI